jgi:hypothetical protein
MTQKDRNFRNIVVALFVGFFLAAGIAIGVSVHLYRAKEAREKLAMVEAKQKAAAATKDANDRIAALEKYKVETIDILKETVLSQENKIVALTREVQTLRKDQRLLSIELDELAASRDSVLQHIQING